MPLIQLHYIGSCVIFFIGLYTVLTHPNLLKKVIGINIMETAVFIFFVSLGHVSQGRPPIILEDGSSLTYVNPLPSALILTGIVVAVSVTAYSLSLIIRLYEHYGTLNLHEIISMREAEQDATQ